MKKSAVDWTEPFFGQASDAERLAQLQQEILSLLENALALAQSKHRDDKESVHALRVLLKHLRAYWQLVRFAVPRLTFQAAKKRMRLTGKQLSAMRDREVLMDTLLDLVESAPESEKACLMEVLKAWMTEPPPAPIPWDKVIHALKKERQAWRKLKFDFQSDTALQDGLAMTFTRCRALGKQAFQPDNLEQRHAWRKWVKYGYYQLKILRQLGLRGQRKRIQCLDELGDLLGREHDFMILESRLKETLSQSELWSEHWTAIQAVYEAKMADFQEQSAVLQRRLSKL